MVCRRAGSTPASCRTPAILPVAVTRTLAPSHTSSYRLATVVMVGANALEPTTSRLPPTHSTVGSDGLVASGNRLAATSTPASNTPAPAVTSGQRDRRTVRSSRIRRPCGPSTPLVCSGAVCSGDSRNTTTILNFSLADRESVRFRRMPCHTGAGGFGAGLAVGAPTGCAGRTSSSTRSCNVLRTLGSGTTSTDRGVPMAGSPVEKNSSALTSSSRCCGTVASEMRAFQMTRPWKVNSTGSSRSLSATSPPVLRMRITTKLRRPTTFATAFSSGAGNSSPSSASCRFTSRPILESLCTRYSTCLRPAIQRCTSGAAIRLTAATPRNQLPPPDSSASAMVRMTSAMEIQVLTSRSAVGPPSEVARPIG